MGLTTAMRKLLGPASWIGSHWIRKGLAGMLGLQHTAGQSEAEDAGESHDRGAKAPG